MKKVLYYAIFITALYACNEQESDLIAVQETPIEYVLKERNSDSPLILSQQKSTLSQEPATRGSATDFFGMLGTAFSAVTYPLTSEDNLKELAIDVPKMEQDAVIECTSRRLGYSETRIFSFSSYNRYIEKSQISKKVRSGFSLNLGLFKVGHESILNHVYGGATSNQSGNVFGELNIRVAEDVYTMPYDSYIRKIILQKYLTSRFKDALYDTPTGEFIKNFGDFFLTKFVTGGCATALYVGESRSSNSTVTRETAMDNAINAGFNFKQVGIDANLNFGSNSSGSGSATSDSISNVKISIKTTGGASAYATFSAPRLLSSISIDLSPWLSSLKDKTGHSFIDIAENGLVPISDLILEKNLSSTVNGESITYTNYYDEPKIVVFSDFLLPDERKYSRINGGYTSQIVSIFLYTRNKESILLTQRNASTLSWLNSEIKRLGNLFGLKIVRQIGNGLYYHYQYSATDMSNSKVYTGIDGKTYILDPTTKTGYSVYKSYVLDIYGIRNLVNSLPKMTISFEELLKYTIFAL